MAGFLVWSYINGRIRRLEIARRRRPYLLVGGLPQDQRRRLLETVLDQDAIAAGTKLAAALVLLLGIRPARITRLRLDDVEHISGTVSISIAKELLLPEPLAELAAQAVADRAARRLLVPVQDRHWLYPGAPTGTPLCPSALVRRLAAVDVTITPARTGALTALPQRLPPPVLAELTGMDPATATRWRSTVSASNAH